MGPGHRGVPLSALITGAMMVLIGFTTITVAWSGFVGARQSVGELWRQLADSLAHQTTAEALRFLQGAEPYGDLSADLIAGGLLDPRDHEAFLAYLEHSVDAHPAFTWTSYADAEDGTFLGVYRVGPDHPLQRTVRRQTGRSTTHYRIEGRDRDGWHPVEAHEGVRHYDPRQRPWYVAAAGRPAGSGIWVDPYLFHSRGQPGVTYALPIRDPADDHLVGVLSVDFEMAPLSDFLATLRIGRKGRAYILTSDGLVIGHPAGRLVRLTAEGSDFYQAAEHPDPMLAAAHAAQQGQVDPWAPFAFGDHLGVATPFPPQTGIPWTVLMVVPRSDLLGHATAQARRSAGFGVLAVLLAIGLGIGLSGVVSRSVGALQAELLRIARFDLFDDAALGSHIRELNDMGQATVVMKQGLRAFARYVPHQLVRQLLSTGGEARLGAERRELSVLFSDIAGFTTVVESTPPDQVLVALGAYLEGMNRAIGDHGGTVCQYLGDGIMAFWGAPEALADHAERTCRGALAMADHARALLSDAEADGRPRLPTRIGIDTGEVMVGNIGAPDRFNYGILGDTVNTAARLEGLNKVYGTSIIAGARTVALAGDAILFRPLDQVLLKGKRRPVLVYEVVAVRADATADQIAWVAAHREALRAYLDRRFAAAGARFEALLVDRPDDRATALLLDRCRTYLAAPPGPDWDGTHVLDLK